MLFIQESNGSWWELDKEKMRVYSFGCGYHDINETIISNSKIIECKNWHELYLKTQWCPLEVNIKWPNVWISPEGKYYNGDAHENRADEILEIIYDKPDIPWCGDKLEEIGWIKATISLMQDVRYDDYWNEKTLTQKQYDALWDWCKLHNKSFPKNIEIK